MHKAIGKTFQIELFPIIMGHPIDMLMGFLQHTVSWDSHCMALHDTFEGGCIHPPPMQALGPGPQEGPPQTALNKTKCNKSKIKNQKFLTRIIGP